MNKTNHPGPRPSVSSSTVSKQSSLLSKYDIPIDYLSFEYISSCGQDQVKTLEKVVKILRSGEEGYYPELQRRADERLQALSPNNPLLRTETPALTRANMSDSEWNIVSQELTSWETEAALRDIRISEENNNTVSEEMSLPPVRQLPAKNTDVDEKPEGAKQVCKSKTDYAAWDRYDPDTELLKMELQEEKMSEQQRQTKKKQETELKRLERVVIEGGKLTETERQVLAEKEKNTGNEYYNTEDYAAAVEYYSASIAVWPTAKAYNNRAQCYLKQSKYSLALDDVNSTLAMEPDNVKALYRRSMVLRQMDQPPQASQGPKQSCAPTRTPRIVDITEARSSTKMKIVEVERSDSYSPSARCAVMDKRSTRNTNSSQSVNNPFGKYSFEPVPSCSFH